MHWILEAAVFLLAALIAVPLFRRAGFGAVLGYLAAGMIIGPFGLGLLNDGEAVMHVAELGVVFLLFVIGLELKPMRLWRLRKAILGSGSLQMLTATLPIAWVV
ncbi:MAG: cation:proton antiporter, partial [Oceanococcaceae bacterium]